MAETVEQSTETTKLTRRRVLGVGASIGAAAWAAPAVVGASSASAQVSESPLLETLVIPTEGRTPITSTISLQAGTTYRLRGSGMSANTGGPGPNSSFDVEWAFSDDGAELDTGGTDFGVKFEPDVPDGGGLAPRWGAYEPTHVYEVLYTPTSSGPVTFSFRDTAYGDNSGSLTVEILST